MRSEISRFKKYTFEIENFHKNLNTGETSKVDVMTPHDVISRVISQRRTIFMKQLFFIIEQNEIRNKIGYLFNDFDQILMILFHC